MRSRTLPSLHRTSASRTSPAGKLTLFTLKANCKLEQVCFNGFDITTSVENNTLKAVIPPKSQMVVMFSKQGDMNNDSKIDISDVVLLVNMILGQ